MASYIDVTNNIDKCTLDFEYNGQTYSIRKTDGTTKVPQANTRTLNTFYLHPDEGYTIDQSNKPYIHVLNQNGSYSYFRNVVDNGDGRFKITAESANTYVYDHKSYDSLADAYGTLIESVEPKKYTITKNVTNCVCDAPDTVEEGAQLTITCTANTGYEFTTQPIISYYDSSTGYPVQKKFTVASDKRKATYTIESAVANYTVQATASEAPTPVKTLHIATQLQSCTSNAPLTVEENTEFTTVVTANEGYKFETTPRYTWMNAEGQPIIKVGTLNETKTQCTITFVAPLYDTVQKGVITLVGTAIAEVPQFDKYGAINVYNVDETQLNKFAQQRYVASTDVEGNTTYDDMGKFIIKLHRVFGDVGTLKDATIFAGRYNTGIATKTPDNDVFTVDFGTVTIPTPNNNIVDYESEVQLYLPFNGFVNINTRDVMGKEVNIVYRYNIVSGDCVAEIKVSGIIIQTFTFKLVTEVFFRTYDNDTYGNVDYNAQSLLGFVPYVVVTSFTSKMCEPYNDNERNTINTFSGYHEFINVENLEASEATADEVNEIINQLKQGVIL